MTTDPFISFCKEKGYAPQGLVLFDKAINCARSYLADEKRLAGDSFFDHNVRVAITLVENKAEPEVVAAGLLHGLLRQMSEKEFRKEFGSPIWSLLKGVEALRQVKLKSEKVEAEALRKIIVAALQDIRVIFIKLANKLDNLDSIHVFPPNEQDRMAQEVLDVYAPLATRLGIDKLRMQLEDRAFEILHPIKYKEIQEFLEESRAEREKDIENSIDLIKKFCTSKVEIISIKGRPKHIHSIYRKMTKRKIHLNKQYDLLGVRAIVPTVKDCYSLLGLLHENFEPLDGRLKDYIANPKTNYYQSIHTGVKLPNGKILEIQIRTPEMDAFAEEGMAAHWRYKGLKQDKGFDKKISWLKGIFDLQKKGKEFVESVKVDVFGDKIYCYSPKGDVKELPVGASVLDFAYSVHEEVGNSSVGGRVNGKFVPLKHTLQNGDVVEVVTHKNQRPRRSWIKIVSSAKSRQKIRKALKEHENLPALHFRKFTPTIKEETGILVESEEFPKAHCVLAKCCRVLPGQDIVGIVTKRKIISVHSQECRSALKEEKRWVPVQWKETFNQKIKFYVDASERSGVLADLLNTIARAGFEVKEAKAKLLSDKKAHCSFLIIPRDLDNLVDLVKRINKVKGVSKIYFE